MAAKQVLIVDDDADVREVTTVIVGSLGYEVLSAMDATEALALIRDHRDIDLLISDIVMSGGIDGFELARRARSSRLSLAILLISGYAAGSTAQAREFPIVHKPYRREELARHIRAALGGPVVLA